MQSMAIEERYVKREELEELRQEVAELREQLKSKADKSERLRQ